MKFFIIDFFSKCNQILNGNFVFCVMIVVIFAKKYLGPCETSTKKKKKKIP